MRPRLITSRCDLHALPRHHLLNRSPGHFTPSATYRIVPAQRTNSIIDWYCNGAWSLIDIIAFYCNSRLIVYILGNLIPPNFLSFFRPMTCTILQRIIVRFIRCLVVLLLLDLFILQVKHNFCNGTVAAAALVYDVLTTREV
jgi:hypothetical protein